MKKTKIICTIGPASESYEKLKDLANKGMNVVRLNLAHGDKKVHGAIMRRVRRLNDENVFPIALMLDTLGPEIRTDNDREIDFKTGDSLKILLNGKVKLKEGEKYLSVDYKHLGEQVNKGEIINLDDGLISLQVTKISKYYIICEVLNSGILGRRKSVNISGLKRDLPAITKKDKGDIKAGVKHKVDFIAQSFVRRKRDVIQMRKLLDRYRSNASIIAKIEDQEGVDNMDEIIEEADGIMVARGDLGVQVPFEDIPNLQNDIVKKCISKGKPVVVATHLLESMIVNPRPTRAEATDIAHAINRKSDCIMLSAETTKGLYPSKCVEAMSKIASKTEPRLHFNIPTLKTKNVKEVLTLGACINAENLDARAIIVFSKSGRLLSSITRKRPNTTVFAFTDSDEIRKKMMIYWGAYPFKIKFSKNFENMAKGAIKILKKHGFVKRKDRLVVISDVRPNRKVDILEVREV